MSNEGKHWEKLLSRDFTLATVSWASLGQAYNDWLYKHKARVLDRLLRRHQITLSAHTRALDVGCGTGYWVKYLHQRGIASLTGVDITLASVTHLSQQYPQDTFLQLDLATAPPTAEPVFDLILAFDVLLHILDEERFRQAITHLARGLAPNGTLVIADTFLIHPWHVANASPSAFDRPRSLALWRETLATCGLTIIELAPANHLLGPVIDVPQAWQWRCGQWYWRALTKMVMRGERYGDLIGRLLYGLEGGLDWLTGPGWSSKIALIRRVDR